MNDKVKEFWDAQAQEHGASDLATAPDHFYRDLEIRKIIEHLEPGRKILDVGCGNGYSTQKFWEACDSDFVGVDYSEKMIHEARKTYSDIAFIVGDVRELSKHAHNQDIIISGRCLINLASWEEQQVALLEMKKCLKPGGTIILVENFKDGLHSLNYLRAQFDLHKIEERWHNRYMWIGEFEPFASTHFDIIGRENIGNLYYIISRAVYAALCKADDKEPAYGHLINKVASQLPSLGFSPEFYSPNFLYVLGNK